MELQSGENALDGKECPNEEVADELSRSQDETVRENKENTAPDSTAVPSTSRALFKPVEGLLSVIVQACDDKAPTVRARAIFQLTEFLGDPLLRSSLPHYFDKMVLYT